MDYNYFLFISAKYGTGHVLVLSHFSPSTRTTDLEKIFEDIKNCDFVIRWVNDTVALAVFRTPAEGNYIITRLY
jgi:hypothetical protein